MPPLTMARTSWRLGSKRRARTVFAWLCCRPTTGLLPQISHCLAICKTTIIAARSRQDQTRSAFARLAARAALVGGALRHDAREQIEVGARVRRVLRAQRARGGCGATE